MRCIVFHFPPHRLAAWLLVLLLGCSASGCASQASAAAAAASGHSVEVTSDGLVSVPSSSLDTALVRPGIDLSSYSAVILERPELAFRRPDREQQEYALTADQQRAFEDMLYEAFSAEIADLQSLRITGEPAAGVLAVSVLVYDIVARVPPKSLSAAGRGSAVLQALGEATLTIELRDSRSKELLARGVDTATVAGVALRDRNEMQTRWNDVDAVCARWARLAREGFDALTSRD